MKYEVIKGYDKGEVVGYFGSFVGLLYFRIIYSWYFGFKVF